MRAAALVAAALCLGVTGEARAQDDEVELVYDDGVANGTLSQLRSGDIEATRLTPAHPVEVRSIRLHVATPSCRAHLFIWGDNGGNAVDLERVLWQTEVDVEASGWLEVELPEGAVRLDPPWHFYVGHQLEAEGTCRLSWDGSGSDEARSMARIDGGWYQIVDGGDPPRAIDALIRARVRYFDVLDDRYFEEVTEEAGLPAGMSRMAWGDYDGDGDDDLLVSGSRLFRNEGDGTFAEVTEAAGLGGAPSNGGVWADYDNDGWLDFYATVNNYLPECDRDEDCLRCTLRDNPDGSRSCDQYIDDHSCEAGRCLPPSGERPHDALWRNNGDGTFSDVSDEAGAPYDFLPSEAAAWGDFDADGFVDLYVANYETPQGWVEGRLSVGTRDSLWRNNGDGTFSDVADEAGILQFGWNQCGRGVAWADYDDDGDLDLYVTNYRLHFNYFFENQGDGTFAYIGHDNGTAGVAISGSYGHSIGAAWGDLDNDGDFDLFVANLAHPRFLEFSDKSMLYRNEGSPDFGFTELREASGIAYSETHSDPALGDFDNDGWLDLLITDIYVGYRAFLYRNNGDLTFTDVTYPSGVELDNGWGSAWADYDGDGRLDLVSRGLWHNQTPEAGHWLEVRLRGTESNAAAIGALVTVTAGGVTRRRQVEGGRGTGVQSSLTLHFGLGEAETAEELHIRWPSGREETFTDLDVDRALTYWEGGEPPGEEADGGPDGGADADLPDDSGPEVDAEVDAGPSVGYSIRGGGCRAASGAPRAAPAILAILALLALRGSRRR